MHFLNFDTWHIKESDVTLLGHAAAVAVCGLRCVPRSTGDAPEGVTVCPRCTSPDAERRAKIDAATPSRP